MQIHLVIYIYMCVCTRIYIYIFIYLQTPAFPRDEVHHVSEHQKPLCFVGQNAHVRDHGFHLATHSLATCALNVTTPSSSSSSS